MTQRTRKFIGTLLVLASIAIYAGLATWLYLSWLMTAPWWLMLIYFAIAGSLWFFPASWIIRWMAKPDA